MPDLLAALDPEQRLVAEALRGPVRVLAGAGTGKTRAITHRIAHGVATGVYAPSEVLAVTFTTRAAGEMRGRLRTLGAGGVQARTFHSAALRQLRYFWPHVHGTELPQITESKLGMLAGAARRQRLNTDQALLRDLASEIEWAKVSNVSPASYVEIAEARGRSVAGQTPAMVAHVFDSYEEVKREQGRMDMEDVLLLTAGMLAEDERVAAQVRRQYKWFVVDEFQDVSPLQSALLDLWLGGRDELCVVGDPAQTIYSFAGANADFLRDFPAKFTGTTSVELVRNYRSSPQVVDAANTLLADTSSKGVDLRSQQAVGSRRDLRRPLRRGRRGRGRHRAHPRAPLRRPRAGRGRRAVPHQRPVRAVRGGAVGPGHPLRHPRRGAVLRAGRGARGGDAHPRRGAVGRGRGRPRDGPRPRSPAWAGRPRRRPPAARPATAGSRGRP